MNNTPEKFIGICFAMMVGGLCFSLELPYGEDDARLDNASPLSLLDTEEVACSEACPHTSPAQRACDIDWTCETLVIADSAELPVSPERSEAAVVMPNGWVAVSNENLDKTRGGFDATPGLKVSFGIARSVSINGELVTKTSFYLPDLRQISREQAKIATTAIQEARIVQNGPGNSVSDSIKSQSPSSTVIQNSLNNQTIQTMTVINTDVNSLGILKSMNAMSTLKDSLLGSIRVR